MYYRFKYHFLEILFQMLDNLAYDQFHDQSYFEKENSRLFSESWVFACTWMEVNGPAKYRLVNTPFGDVIVSSDGNNPAAFYNKCMHRGHQLIQSKRFEGDLICPYHGWHYDSKGGLVEPGVLANIPGDQKFYGIGRHDYNGKSIQNLAAARVGDLVFINAGEKPSPGEPY